MANKYDYLTEYRQFFEEFANTVEPNDQLPVKLGSYKFINSEVVGGIVDWCLQYLTRKSCPSTLIGPLIKITIDEIRIACKRHPIACGFNPNENVYEPLKLMQTVMSKMNEVCLRYLDNAQLDTLPTPPSTTPPSTSTCASRNTRRRMEDRHVVIHDINSMFNIQDASPASYYAVFDGHAGSDAAAYSAAHLHQFLVESVFYPSDPEKSLKEAFLRTDEFFLEKSKIENFRSGTTAVCALYKPKEETLYVAWVGDSQALLVNRGKVLQIVKPHKPCREDEKDRIEANGGCVMFWGMWRVNGQLAVSRAIGDLKLKPYVTAEPDIVAVPLDGNEEFLIMACDGLWDFVSEDDAAIAVYKKIKENPENIEGIAEALSDLAKQEGSRDNISVIVIFLKDPVKIAKKLTSDWNWATKSSTDVNMEDVNNASNNQFDLFDVFQKRGLDPFDETDFKPNGNEAKNTDSFLFDRPANNGKRRADDFEDDDLGPETNVDEELSPIIEGRKLGNVNEACERMDTLDVDLELQRQQSSEFEPLREPREETPTPPADSVLDSSGLAENVAESEDSEDEWNYYKVDPKQKENSLPPAETSNEVSPQDEMSQLNPDAKEFVPVSPTRVAGSLVSPVPRDLVDDTLIAQSPRRAVPMDISVPSPGEFQIEVKQRPSELFDDGFEDTVEQNGHAHAHALSSQEIMQNLLNGKDASEIEFRPQHFTKPAADNDNCINQNRNETSTPSEEENPTESSLSPTGDDSDFAAFVPKAQDPMVDSFYQDKEETGFSTNPFDLNQVQVLPDNVDDFLQPEERISPAQSPLGIPLADTPVQSEEQVDLLNAIAESIVPNNVEESKSPLLVLSKSPVLDIENKSLVELANSPIPSLPEPIELAKSPASPVCQLAGTVSPEPVVAKSPEIAVYSPESIKSPLLEVLATSPEREVPVILQSPLPDVLAKSPAHSPLPVLDVQTSVEHSPFGPLSPKSPIPELTGLVSPDITTSIKDDNISGELSEAKSPETAVQEQLEQEAKSPGIPNIVSPVKQVAQNVEQTLSELVEQTTDFIHQVGDDIQRKINSADTKVEDLISDAIQDIVENKPIIETPKSSEMLQQISSEFPTEIINTSIISSEIPSINSFLERSVVPEVTSPLSPTEEVEKFQTEPPEGWKQNVEIKCDIIKPEFAIHTIASPSEESKGTDTPPPTATTGPELKEIVEAVEKLETVKAQAATDVKKDDIAAKTSKTTSKPLATKKPLSKLSPTSPSKPLPSKTTSTTTSTIKRTSTTPSKTALPAKRSTTPLASPRTAITRTTPKPLEKKPLSNGDVKPLVKSTLIKRTATSTTSAAAKSTTSATAAIAEKKLSPMKAATTRPGNVGAGAARPATSTRTASATTRPATGTSTTRKPASLAPKATASGTATKTVPSRSSTAGTLKASTTAAKPRPSSTSAAPKPRLASTLPPKPITRTADSEKDKKETVNKQLSASRTASRTTTLTARKVDVKASSTARTTTRTTTTTIKSATKKPEVTKTTITKTRSTSAVTKPLPEQQNGVVSVVQEITTIVSEEPQLVKDHSPVQIDNSQLTEIIAD